MLESLTKQTLANIHFPRQIRFIKRMQMLSFFMNDSILLFASILLLFWFIRVPTISDLLYGKSGVYPFTLVLFIFSGIPLLFGAKRHLFDTHRDAPQVESPLWRTLIPVFFAILTALGGLINLLHLTNSGLLAPLHTSLYSGFCFFLLGIALIPPFTLIPHRFHITHFLLFIVSALNVYIVLEFLYQVFSSETPRYLLNVSLLAPLTFIFLCSGILLRWTNRGFLGNFTLDATASIFALRVFLINLFLAPVLTLIVLFFLMNSSLNMFQIITVIVVAFAFISSLLIWANIKILYNHELEHLLMKESLQFHNIDLKQDQGKLQKRLEEIEQEKEQYLDKLSSRNAWQDAIDRIS